MEYFTDEFSEITEQQIQWLIKLCYEPSYTLPRGLTREERREWCKKNALTDSVVTEGDIVASK